jgi:hypothetical protein
MTPVTAEVTWLQWLLDNFGVSISMVTPLLIQGSSLLLVIQ